MDFIYDTYYFKTKIEIEPNKINSFTNNYIDKNITLSILNKFEEKCNYIGYIKKDSIKLIKRSLGFHNPITFNNKIYFNVLCSAKICKPIKNNIYFSKITGINKIGIIAQINSVDNSIPLSIIISKHNQTIDISNLKVGDNIYIEILATKFTLNSTTIKTIANIIDDNFIKNLSKQKIFIDEIINYELPNNYKKFINNTYLNNLKYIINSNNISKKILFIYTYLRDINKYELKKININKIKKNYLNYINSINNKNNNEYEKINYLKNEYNIKDDEQYEDLNLESQIENDETDLEYDNNYNDEEYYNDDINNNINDDINDDINEDIEDDDEDDDDDNDLEDEIDDENNNIEINLEGSGSGSIGSGSYKCI